MKRNNWVIVFCIALILSISCVPANAMTDQQKRDCHIIIHLAAADAAACSAALAQAPGADNVTLALSIGIMTGGLAGVFGVTITESAQAVGTKILSNYAWELATRVASQWAVGWIPFIGNSINSMTMAWFVEEVGWAVADALDTGNWRELLLP